MRNPKRWPSKSAAQICPRESHLEVGEGRRQRSIHQKGVATSKGVQLAQAGGTYLSKQTDPNVGAGTSPSGIPHSRDSPAGRRGNKSFVDGGNEQQETCEHVKVESLEAISSELDQWPRRFVAY